MSRKKRDSILLLYYVGMQLVQGGKIITQHPNIHRLSGEGGEGKGKRSSPTHGNEKASESK